MTINDFNNNNLKRIDILRDLVKHQYNYSPTCNDINNAIDLCFKFNYDSVNLFKHTTNLQF